MKRSFPQAHRRMLVYEGGYSNHHADPGGVTLNGVTQERYDQYRRANNKPQKALTRAMLGDPEWIIERDTIYQKYYWHPPECDALEPGVDAAIYDYSVNSGPDRAAKVLQRLVGVDDDGRVGPITIAAARKRDAKVLAGAICDERLAFMKRLSHWPTFALGWTRRVADVKKYTSKMAENLPVTPPNLTTGPAAKAEVPEPTTAKNVVVAAPVAAAAGGSTLFWDWVSVHPVASGFIVAAIVVAIGLAIHGISKWRKAKQDAPTPGFGVVPEKK